jgi:hypothetical protein
LTHPDSATTEASARRGNRGIGGWIVDGGLNAFKAHLVRAK